MPSVTLGGEASRARQSLEMRVISAPESHLISIASSWREDKWPMEAREVIPKLARPLDRASLGQMGTMLLRGRVRPLSCALEGFRNRTDLTLAMASSRCLSGQYSGAASERVSLGKKSHSEEYVERASRRAFGIFLELKEFL